MLQGVTVQGLGSSLLIVVRKKGFGFKTWGFWVEGGGLNSNGDRQARHHAIEINLQGQFGKNSAFWASGAPGIPQTTKLL